MMAVKESGEAVEASATAAKKKTDTSRTEVDTASTEPGDLKLLNVFKVKIDGYSMMSDARYTSDYFDQSALNNYFGTFSQDKAKLPNPSGTTTVGLGKDAGKSGDLVMLLSSNASAFTQAVGALANSEAAAKDLVRLARKDVYQPASDAQGEAAKSAAATKAKSKQIVTEGERLIEPIKPEDNKADAIAKVLAFANQIAAASGRKPFNDVAALNTIPPRGGK